MSELYVELELVENAIPHLEYVINTTENRYKEQSLLTFAQILIDMEAWVKAVPVLETLKMKQVIIEMLYMLRLISCKPITKQIQ